jgi:hypothetical protein
MAIHPIQTFVIASVATMGTCWTPAVPREILDRAREHLRIEGGTATVSFEFDVRDGQARTCRVRVDGSRRA